MAKTGKALKRKQAKSTEKMNMLTVFFVVGVLLETYLLLVNQFYAQGTGAQMMTMSNVLVAMGFVGLVWTAVGAALYKGNGKLKPYSLYVSGSGVLVALTSLLCLKVNTAAAGMLSVAVPVALLLAVVYTLYVSDFFWLALSMTVSLGAVWYWRRCFAVNYLRLSAVVLMLLAVALVAGIMVLTFRALKNRGIVVIRERRIRMTEKDSKSTLLVLHGLCLAVLLLSAAVSAVALYGFLLLGVMLFASAVYYTVSAL